MDHTYLSLLITAGGSVLTALIFVVRSLQELRTRLGAAEDRLKAVDDFARRTRHQLNNAHLVAAASDARFEADMAWIKEGITKLDGAMGRITQQGERTEARQVRHDKE